MGLDEFIEQLRQEMRERYREFNLKNALSEMEQKLEDILNQERQTLDSTARARSPASRTRIAQLSKMPRQLSEAIRKLESYDFEDADAKADFDELLDEYENIRDLENFRDRYQPHVPRAQEPRLRAVARPDARDGADAPARTGSDVGQLRDYLDGGSEGDARAAGACRISRTCAR